MAGTLRDHRVAVGLLAIAALAAGFWGATQLRARDDVHVALPQESGQRTLAGLTATVAVDRDRHGIPHIQAENERDAFRGLGFVHAQDRLAQLLHLRRTAHGTASEVAGREAVAGDRLARWIDLAGLADRQWENLASSTRRALEAYAEGVNARIAHLEEGREPDADPVAPWLPQDSLAVFKLFAWGQSESVEASLVLNELVAALGSTEAARFFPPRASDEGPAGRATAASASEAYFAGARSLQRALGQAGYGVGSAAFVVGGSHTENGKPILVADSHFEPTAPAALHLAHLQAPGLDVAGATLPGVPVFWWGRNPELAWASVNAGAVVSDLYVETTRKDGAEVHDGRRWQTLATRTETLRVRGAPDVVFEVRQGARGPLLEGVEGDEAISVAWTGARTDGASGIGSLLRVARAGDGEALRKALARHHEPPIAMVWAAGDGDAGLQMAGWIPRRTLASQLLPLPGRARWYAWDEPIAFDALPANTLEQGKGFAIAADQLFESEDEEAPIDGVWRTGARHARIAILLGEATREDTTLRGLAEIPSDVALDRSRALVAVALGLAGDAIEAREAQELAALLRDWDGRASRASVGATAYHTTLHVLAESLFEDRMGPARYRRFLALRSLDLEALVYGVLLDAAAGRASDSWADPQTVRDAIVASFGEAWLSLSYHHGPDPRRWAWGKVHALRFRPLSRGRPTLGPFPHGGGPHAPLAGSYSHEEAAEGRFDVRVAGTARFAIDADSLDLALVALAPGQHEHPEHPHFDDALALWSEGRFSLLATRQLEIEDRSVARLVLEPVR